MCLPAALPAMATAAMTAVKATAPTIMSALANPVTQLALTAAGTGAQIMGQRQAQQAQDNAIAAENRRQEEFDRRIQQQRELVQNDSRRNVIEEDTVRTERRVKRDNAQQKANEPNLRQALPGGGQMSRSVASSGARDAQAGEARNERIADAFARMAGHRRATVNHNNSMADAFGKMQSEGVMARGSAGVLPLEMQAAAREGQGLRTLGDVLNATAMISAGAGGFKGLFGGAKPPTPVPASTRQFAFSRSPI